MRLKVKAEEKGKKGERRCRGSRISRDGKSRVNTFSEKKTT